MAALLGHLLSQFPSRRVLVIGDLILDEYIIGESSRISPEAPVPVLQFSSLRAVLGGAANTAANVASLGGRVTLIGLVGDGDDASREIARLCDAAAIRLVTVVDGRSTTRKVRVIGQRQQLLRLDYEHVAYLDRAREERVIAAFARELPHADIVVISDYAKGFITGLVCQQVISMTHAAGKEVIVDPRPQHAPFYAHCDYLAPNWKESQGLLGWNETTMTDQEIDRTGALIARQFHSNVLLTLGPRGIAFFGRHDDERFVAPAVVKDVFDVSGAGDTVVAAFALARAAGCNHFDAVALANRAAGIAVVKQGTAAVTAEELLASDGIEPRVAATEALTRLASLLRSHDRRVVTAAGIFDFLHMGHLQLLREARQQGDVLIVGVYSDLGVRARTGPGRPIVPEAQRAEMLLALRVVDYVHIIEGVSSKPFLEQVRPDVHVHGSEDGDAAVEAVDARAIAGRVHHVRRLPVFSPAELFERQ